MKILTPEQVQEWVRLDAGQDTATLDMLEAGAIDIVQHRTGLRLLPYIDADGNEKVPFVPETLKHAIVLLVHAHYDERTGADDRTMTAVHRLCAPYRVPTL